MNPVLTAIITPLIVIAVIALVIFIIVMIIKHKLESATRRYLGMGLKDTANMLGNGLREETTMPKAISNVSAIYKPRLMRDFPDMTYERFLEMANTALVSILTAIESGDADRIGNATDSLKSVIRDKIHDNNGRNIVEHFDDIKLHRTAISDYRTTSDTATADFEISFQCIHYLEGKDKVMEGLKKGIFYRRDDGSVWADLTDEGLDEKLLLRADGTSVYMTQDIGTAKLRYEDFPIDKMIYVVGNEQNYHFQVLSILLDKLGFKWGRDLVHFSYGMVELPNGKMKSREGTVVDADDLIAKMIEDAATMSEDKVNKLEGISEAEAAEIARIVGMGALKYFILKVDARKNMLFNPEESIDFNGNTGPFIQYTYARIRSILRKANGQWTMDDCQCSLSEKEIALIQRLAAFGASVAQAGSDYNVSVIANYCYDLAKEFNGFYHDFQILKEPDEQKRAMRLALCEAVAKVIKTGLGLLGIEVPERRPVWGCWVSRCRRGCNGLSPQPSLLGRGRLPPR